MPRIRTIKPEFWQDEKLSPCDPLTRLVFLGLVSLADDAGRLVDNLRLIDAQIFPNTSDTAHEALMRLSGMGRIRRGVTASGQRIIEIANWSRHQKIQHANLKGALPEIVEEQQLPVPHERLMRDSGAAHESLTHHTNDLRPTTNDQHTNDLSAAPRARRPRQRSEPGVRKYPHFSDDHRARVIAAWKKVGVVNVDVLLRAVALAYRPADDPEHIPHEYVTLGVEDYCGLIGKGRSAPFARPDDLARKLLTLARNCQTYEQAFDPVGRADANFMAIHGHKMAGAA